jgi:hypothetical protein
MTRSICILFVSLVFASGTTVEPIRERRRIAVLTTTTPGPSTTEFTTETPETSTLQHTHPLNDLVDDTSCDQTCTTIDPSIVSSCAPLRVREARPTRSGRNRGCCFLRRHRHS